MQETGQMLGGAVQAFGSLSRAGVTMTASAGKLTSILIAGVVAGIAGAIPSTVYLLLTDGDMLAPLNALAAIVNANDLSILPRLVVAGSVHFAVSLFWAWVLTSLLPKNLEIFYAIIASLIIAVFDLQVIARLLFPRLASLAFLPQLADHLLWGATAGWVIQRRRRRTQRRQDSDAKDGSRKVRPWV